MKPKLRILLASMTTASIVLSGCAVRPAAYSQQQLTFLANENMASLNLNQEPITKPIDLHEAMARALKYNLDYRVKKAQANLSQAKLKLANYNGLPDVVANSGYSDRNNRYASRSIDLATNNIDANSSTSQDQKQTTQDLTFSWNILDFGLSYIHAKQSADKVLISRELERNVRHQLLEKVRTAYWHAVAYQRLATRLQKLEKRTNRALRNSRRLSDSYQTSRLKSLNAERELIKIKQAIKILQRDHASAKIELAQLMNLIPGTKFELDTTIKQEVPSDISLSLQEMMKAAARDRPEIREIMYKQRISLGDAKAAVLEILPGLRVYSGDNWDSNSFLVNSNWVSWGANVSWSLIKLFQYPAKKYEAEQRVELYKQRALAMTMSVLTQVHLSRIRYLHYKQDFKIANDYRDVQQRLVRQMRVEAKAHVVSEQELLLEEMNTLIADAKYDIAYAELQAAYANLFASMGSDPYGPFNPKTPVKIITASLKKHKPKTGE